MILIAEHDIKAASDVEASDANITPADKEQGIMSQQKVEGAARPVNFYRKYIWQCVICGGAYNPCSPHQRTCSRKCGTQLRERTRLELRRELIPLTIKGDTAVIFLTKGKHALIDTADWPEISKYEWHYHSDGGAARRQNNRSIRMHQQLCPCPDGLEPDHKDLDRLNNRRSNLRLATSSEQKMNQRLKCDNTSGFKGVAWCKDRNKWKAYVTKDGLQVTIGYFDMKVHAALCRAAVAKFLFGEFARESK